MWYIPVSLSGILFATGNQIGTNLELKASNLVKYLLSSIENLLYGAFSSKSKVFDTNNSLTIKETSRLSQYLSRQRFVIVISTGTDLDVDETESCNGKFTVPCNISCATGLSITLSNISTLCPNLLPYLHYLHVQPSKYAITAYRSHLSNSILSVSLRDKVLDNI